MKKFKKLIPAFCAMLVSAAMLGTSTYAWFSVNKEVTATDMSVTAVANTQYFVVRSALTAENKFTSADLTANTTAKATLATGGIAASQENTAATQNVYPVAYTKTPLKTTNNTTEKNDVEADNWYWGGVSADNATQDPQANTKFTTLSTVGEDSYAVLSGNRNYFVGYKFYVGLADNTASCEQFLQFEAENKTNAAAIAGIAVKHSSVTGTYTYVPFAAATEDIKTEKYSFVAKNATAGTEATYVEVIVFVYIDGTNNEIMSKNIKTGGNSTQLTGSIGLKVTAKDK